MQQTCLSEKHTSSDIWLASPWEKPGVNVDLGTIQGQVLRRALFYYCYEAIKIWIYAPWTRVKYHATIHNRVQWEKPDLHIIR